MYKTILVPLDGSKRAEAILPFVESLAECYRAEVILLPVIEPQSRIVGSLSNTKAASQLSFVPRPSGAMSDLASLIAADTVISSSKFLGGSRPSSSNNIDN